MREPRLELVVSSFFFFVFKSGATMTIGEKQVFGLTQFMTARREAARSSAAREFQLNRGSLKEIGPCPLGKFWEVS